MKTYKASFVMNVDEIQEGAVEIEASSKEDAVLRLTEYLENYPDGIDGGIKRFVIKKKTPVIITEIEIKI